MKSCIAFDPDETDVNEDVFNAKAVWDDLYAESEELLSPNMPKTRGKTIYIHCFVDSNHAGNKVTRRSHTGFLIYLLNSPIIWFRKRQNTIERSYFGSEFVEIRIAVENIKALPYKLRMFRVPITGPANVFCNNQGVFKNTSIRIILFRRNTTPLITTLFVKQLPAALSALEKKTRRSTLLDVLIKVISKRRKDNLISYILYPNYFHIVESYDNRKKP